jgi:lipooligosaccharide transport system permease protein
VNAAKVVHKNSIVAWRAWRSSLFLSVLGPVMFLAAMGLGLGSLVESGSDRFANDGYLEFFATGMLVASAMQNGVFSASYPILSKIIWQRNYEAILATPLTVRDVYFGELAWIGIVLSQQTIPFFAVMALFGIFDSPVAILAIPVAVLTGLGCAAWVTALTATLQEDEAYTWLFRFIVTPLFLLSGTFFPIDSLPEWGLYVARATPLYHGIELVRQLAIYDVSLGSAAGHLAYLFGFLVLGSYFGLRNMRRRLVV